MYSRVEFFREYYLTFNKKKILSETVCCFLPCDSDVGRDWRQEEKGTMEDEMVGWHHWLEGHEFEQAPRVGDRQWSLACCSPWGHKEAKMTERFNWTELISYKLWWHCLRHQELYQNYFYTVSANVNSVESKK